MQKKFQHPAPCPLLPGERHQRLNYQQHRQAHRFEEYCRFFDITRQGYHQHREHQRKQELVLMQRSTLVVEIHFLRKHLPRLGGRKLRYNLNERVPVLLVGIGRDAFFDFLREHGLLVTPKKLFRAKTTDSRHTFRHYPDCYNEHRSRFYRPFMTLVADITYIQPLRGLDMPPSRPMWLHAWTILGRARQRYFQR